MIILGASLAVFTVGSRGGGGGGGGHTSVRHPVLASVRAIRGEL